MKTEKKFAVKWAGVSAVSLLLVAGSAFADAPSNHRNRAGRQDTQTAQRQNQRPVQVQQRAQTAAQPARPSQFGQWAGSQQRSQQQNQLQQAQRSYAHNVQQRVQPAPAVASTRGQWSGRDASRSTSVSYGNHQINPAQQYRSGQTYRDNQRVNVTGRVSSFNRERDGYRVHLDRGGSYWIPQARLGNRALRVGLSIGLGGIFNGGVLGIDAITWPGAVYDQGYDQGFVQGVIERVDYGSGIMELRDDANGRLINVDMRSASSAGNIGFNDVRPGDAVTLSGQWARNDLFAAYRIDDLNNGQY